MHLSKLLRRFVRIAVPDHELLTFSDVELMDDVMRYGNLGIVAKKRGCSLSFVSVHLHKILDQLEERVSLWETAQSLTIEQNSITELEKMLQKERQRRAELEEELKDVQESNIKSSRKLTVMLAHKMATLAVSREGQEKL